ncbi:I78 family peptidase inhibitor [Paracoccus cavernae]|uniref:I78 family peptidase inhibitor n=1 Tax=Paracoccus cavernae TaxID=1571207 RepID=A0ABT8D6R3_9RHOB|nr:I78 family peptidase inhibitor [Paracoccus cavernae]
MKPWMVLAPALALAACVQTDVPAVTPPAASDACGAAKLQGLIGQPAAAVERMSFASGTRILRPNMPVTADYRVDRLNIEINASGKVEKVACY